MTPYTNQMAQVEYSFRTTRTKAHHKGEKTKVVNYCDDIMTFDIEVSSGWIDETGEVIGYHTGESSDYWNSLEPVALCYIWQFSFNDHVYYGRDRKSVV